MRSRTNVTCLPHIRLAAGRNNNRKVDPHTSLFDLFREGTLSAAVVNYIHSRGVHSHDIFSNERKERIVVFIGGLTELVTCGARGFG